MEINRPCSGAAKCYEPQLEVSAHDANLDSTAQECAWMAVESPRAAVECPASLDDPLCHHVRAVGDATPLPVQANDVPTPRASGALPISSISGMPTSSQPLLPMQSAVLLSALPTGMTVSKANVGQPLLTVSGSLDVSTHSPSGQGPQPSTADPMQTALATSLHYAVLPVRPWQSLNETVRMQVCTLLAPIQCSCFVPQAAAEARRPHCSP